MDALQAFCSITEAGYRFSPKLLASLADDQALPPTAQLLDTLDGRGPSQSQAPRTMTLPLEKLQAAVSEEVTEYFGPIGSALRTEQFRALSPTDSETLTLVVERIVAQLGSERLGKELASKTMQRIDHILGSP